MTKRTVLANRALSQAVQNRPALDGLPTGVSVTTLSEYGADENRDHALPGYTLRELKNRAVAMAQTTYRSTVAE